MVAGNNPPGGTEAQALAGRTALVTGASRGLGLAIAEAYLRAGARVVLAARDPERLAAAAAALGRALDARERVLVVPADVTCPEAVETLVERTRAAFGRLDILVSNAGVQGPIGSLEAIDWVDWTRAVETNLYGAALLFRAVLPLMKAQRAGKIVQLSGGGATSPMPRMTAYAASKAALVRLVESVAEDVKGFGIDVNALAPGALATDMLTEVLAAGPERVGAAYHAKMRQVAEAGGTPLASGAALAVWLASSASDGVTGRLLSAVWDPWPTLQARREALAASDIYTLRRIVPADRAEDWGTP